METKPSNHTPATDDRYFSVGSGTPLHDSDDRGSAVYAPAEHLNPLVGIGPGTPLNDPEPEARGTAPSPKPEPMPAPAPAPVSAPAEEPAASVAEPEAEEEAEEEGSFAREMEQALEAEPVLGDIIKGRVLRIDEEGVVVDIGSKSEGIIPREEFLDARGEFATRVGEEIEVLLERRENREGLLVLSKRKVDRRRVWNQAKAALANNVSVTGVIYQTCKGGFMVDLGGAQAFLPASQVDLATAKNPEAYLNQRHQFKIIKMNKERGNIVVSRRNHLLDERQKKRDGIIAGLTPGRLVHGVVKNLTNYGAFVDIGGMDALLHVNDMSWSRVTHPRQIVNVGDEIEALILSVDPASGKVALGLKQKSEDPWQNLAAKYPVGSLVEGEVVTLTDFGAFLRLEEGVEGLLPISEMSWTRRIKHPKELLKLQDLVRVKVLALDPQAKKITLGLRQTEQEPFSAYTDSHRAGETVTGEVKSLTRFGAFVELAEGVTGLVHLSDLSWDGALKDPGEVLKTGDRIQVKILDVQRDKKKIALGIKQLTQDPWIEAAKKYPAGAVVKATVVRNTKFGVFVQLEPGVEGLIHVSQLDRPKGQADPAPIPEGTVVDAKVVKVNLAEHKLGLSIREAMQEQEAAEVQKYLSPTNKPTISLAEASGVDWEALRRRVSGEAPSE
ncbi:MAG: 30S ribosomal protein S1 [candidate division FCPU426 bacterium]